MFEYGNAGAPQALLQSCLTFGAFSFIIEGLNKQQPALAHSFSVKHRCRHCDAPGALALPGDYHNAPHPLALPLSVPLPNELKVAFSFFCKSLGNPSINFPTASDKRVEA